MTGTVSSGANRETPLKVGERPREETSQSLIVVARGEPRKTSRLVGVTPKSEEGVGNQIPATRLFRKNSEDLVTLREVL